MDPEFSIPDRDASSRGLDHAKTGSGHHTWPASVILLALCSEDLRDGSERGDRGGQSTFGMEGVIDGLCGGSVHSWD